MTDEPTVADPTPTPEGDLLDTGNVSEKEYTTRGQTKVATKRGWRFAPKDKDLPVITSAGVFVTREQAEALVEESDGLVKVVAETKED